MRNGIRDFLLPFVGGLLGNLLTPFLEDYLKGILPGPTRLWLTLTGILIAFVVQILLGQDYFFPLSWWGLRYVYCKNCVKAESLSRWQDRFAQLEIQKARHLYRSVEVVVDGRLTSLVDYMVNKLSGGGESGFRCLLLGEPGSGKTTGMERVTLELARIGARRLGSGNKIPVLVVLRNHKTQDIVTCIHTVLKPILKNQNEEEGKRKVEQLLKRGCIVLLLDGLDEAFGAKQDEIMRSLREFLTSYPITSVVVTTRTKEFPVTDSPNPLLKECYTIEPLSDDSVRKFISVYRNPSSAASEQEIWDRLVAQGLLQPLIDSDGVIQPSNQPEQSALPAGEKTLQLARNPFWLSALARLNDPSKSKGAILSSIIHDALSDELNRPGEVRSMWRRLPDSDHQIRETTLGLSWLAYRMFTSTDYRFVCDTNWALQITAGYLTGRPGVVDLRAQDVLGLGRDAKLILYYPEPVQFRHRLIQEYLTAYALTKQPDIIVPGWLENAIEDASWSEVIALLEVTGYPVVSKLRELLGASSLREMQDAILSILGEIGSAEAVKAIIPFLTCADAATATVARRQVARVGSVARGPLLAAFESCTDPEYRLLLTELLVNIAEPRITRVLCEQLASCPVFLLPQVISQLSRTKDVQVLDACAEIAERLQHNPDAMISAAKAATVFEPGAAVLFLARLFVFAQTASGLDLKKFTLVVEHILKDAAGLDFPDGEFEALSKITDTSVAVLTAKTLMTSFQELAKAGPAGVTEAISEHIQDAPAYLQAIFISRLAAAQDAHANQLLAALAKQQDMEAVLVTAFLATSQQDTTGELSTALLMNIVQRNKSSENRRLVLVVARTIPQIDHQKLARVGRLDSSPAVKFAAYKLSGDRIPSNVLFDILDDGRSGDNLIKEAVSTIIDDDDPMQIRRMMSLPSASIRVEEAVFVGLQTYGNRIAQHSAHLSAIQKSTLNTIVTRLREQLLQSSQYIAFGDSYKHWPSVSIMADSLAAYAWHPLAQVALRDCMRIPELYGVISRALNRTPFDLWAQIMDTSQYITWNFGSMSPLEASLRAQLAKLSSH